MSRVGNRVLTLPEGVTIIISSSNVEVKGKNGSLTREFSPLISIEEKDGKIITARANEEKHTKQLHGTTNSLLNSMIIGVSEGFKKEIEIKGVGYKAILKGKQIEINVGYSHPYLLDIPETVKVKLPKPTEITITGPDKQMVGQMAAIIRDVRRPSPYSGKGIMYKGEIIRRKEGKAAAK
ncbi:50S ribosomal protein L6 [Candidatus Mycoplasma mahonii]|uniref:50S ribosomal protein L6 n=1 Tax=Candidatus Mycoplasma mahonii TaxID=3004105 RepID=UPI0026F10686|nr:50S ribosomal protein L6 [Candidatus Mycoplasma mahonii]WKX02239.1 50S ribosomal protein L6 [Candidatus Mycoplasma mahonii]